MEINRIYIPADKDCIELLEPWSIDKNYYGDKFKVIEEQKPEWINKKSVTLPAGTQIRFVRVCVGNSPNTNIDIRHPDLSRMIMNHRLSNNKINEIRRFKTLDGFESKKTKKPLYRIEWSWYKELRAGLELTRFYNIRESDYEKIGDKRIKVKVATDNAHSSAISPNWHKYVAYAEQFVYCDVKENEVDKWGVKTKEVSLIIDYWEWDLYGYDKTKLGTYKTKDSLRRVAREYIDKDINKAKAYFKNK